MGPRAPDAFAESLRAAFADAGMAAPRVLSQQALAGGSINQACLLRTTTGDFFCKWNPEAPPDMFPTEKEGLAALAAAGALAVPKAIGLCPGGLGRVPLLLLEYLEPASPGPAAWEALGRGLARLHASSSDRFGFAHDNYCGLTPQENTWEEDWAEFYARRRIGALLGRLERMGRLDAAKARLFHRFLEKLPSLLSHRPKPSLIHGDLWRENFLATRAGPALIDPAAHFADREAEWGMMTLFGGFPGAVFDAYQEAWPLPAGWKDRLPAYQAYHILNHFFLFDGHYGEAAAALVRKVI